MNGLVMTVVVFVIMALYSIDINAQQLKIEKHGEVLFLNLDKDWYMVQRLGVEDECCNSRRYFGKINRISKDSIHLETRQFEGRSVDDEKSYYSKVKFNTKKEFPIYSIAKSDLKNIQPKGSKLKPVFMATGGVLLFTSVATAIHSLIVNKDDRNALLISAGIQIGASVALITLGKSKREKYIIHENAWQFSD